MKERKRAEKSWDEKQIKVKMENHSEKKKKLKLKKEKLTQPLVGVLLTPYSWWAVPKMRSAECGVRVKKIKKKRNSMKKIQKK